MFLFWVSICVAQTDYTWKGGEGLWMNNENWTPNLSPPGITETSLVYIDGGKAEFSTSTLVDGDPEPRIHYLEIDENDCLLMKGFTRMEINKGPVELNGTWKIDNAQGANLTFNDDIIITGTGVWDMSEARSVFYSANPTSLTIGPDLKVLLGGDLTSELGGLINRGTILAGGEYPLSIYPGERGLVNHGWISSTAPNVRFAPGTIKNTGGVLGAEPGSVMEFDNNVIQGGKLISREDGRFVFSYNTFLNDVDFGGTVTIGDEDIVTVTVGISNTGDVFMTDTVKAGSPTMVFSDGAVISGPGSIHMADRSGITVTHRISLFTGPLLKTPGIFTNTVQHSITGSGNILYETGGIVNFGRIHGAEFPGILFHSRNPGLFNQGYISTDVVEGIVFDDTVITQTASVTETYKYSGAIHAEDGGSVLFKNAAVSGGSLISDGAGRIIFSYNTFLRDLVLDGSVYNDCSSNISVSGVLKNSGTMEFCDSGYVTVTNPLVFFEKGSLLTGTGEFILPDSSKPHIAAGGLFTQGPFHTIRGAGSVFNGVGGMVNQGILVAQGTSPLVFNPGDEGFLNSGEIIVQPNGLCRIMNSGVFENLGVINVMDNATLSMGDHCIQEAGEIILGEGSEIIFDEATGNVILNGGKLSGNGAIEGGMINNSGIIMPGTSAGTLTMKSLENNGTMIMEITGSDPGKYDHVNIKGTAALGGVLDLRFTDSFIPDSSDVFEIMSWGSLSSKFDEVLVCGLPLTLDASVEYYDDALEVSLIPVTPTPTPTPENAPPSIELLTPAEEDEISTSTFMIEWLDEDPDDNASINLYYNTTPTTAAASGIIFGIKEDDETDMFPWDTSRVLEGVYYVFGEIKDKEQNKATSFAPGTVKVTHITAEDIIFHILDYTPISPARRKFGDFNGDGIIDVADLVFLMEL